MTFYIAPGGAPLLRLDDLRVFANELRERLGPSDAAREAKAGSWVDLPSFAYVDLVAVRSEKIHIEIVDPRAKEVLHSPGEKAPAVNVGGLERMVGIKREATVVVCPNRKVAEFACEHYRDSISRDELAKIAPEFRCEGTALEGLAVALRRL